MLIVSYNTTPTHFPEHNKNNTITSTSSNAILKLAIHA